MTAQERTYSCGKLLLMSALYDAIDAMTQAEILRSNAHQGLLLLGIEEEGKRRDYRLEIWSTARGSCLRIETMDCWVSTLKQQQDVEELFRQMEIHLEGSVHPLEETEK